METIACKNCKQTKPATPEFFSPYTNPGREPSLRKTCKECTNKQKAESRKRRGGYSTTKHWRDKRSKFVSDQKSPCIVCGWFEHPCGIDFHHIDPKTKSFPLSQSSRVARVDQIQAEIDKCVCLCANCHRLHHAGLIDLEDHLR